MRTILAVLLSFPLSIAAQAPQAPPDLILLNGKVFTADPAKPSAEAVAIRGDRIIATGNSAEIARRAGANTRRIDLQGRTVVPGLNDAHFHFDPDPEGSKLELKTMEPTWAETEKAIRAEVAQAPARRWIFAEVGSDVVMNPDVNRFALDRIATNHPVLIRAYYGHGYIINSKAMRLLQIRDKEPDPVGGYFERVGGSKRISGRFGEYAEWKPSRILANQVDDEDIVKRLRALADEAVRYGMTSMQIMSSLSVDKFARLLAKADLPIRVRAISFSMTTPQGRDLSEIRKLSKLRFPGSRVTVSGIKWVLDGTPFERGAALRTPYRDRPNWSGKLNFPESEIAAMVKESLEFKQPLLLHCAGDKSAEAVLDAMESYGSRVDWTQRRVRIEHGDGLINDLVPRAVRLGVIVVQNPTHFAEPETFQRRWGAGMQPLRSLIEAGIPVALGSDGPLNPFLNIMLATIHPYSPKEAVTREQAVRAYTFGSAFAEFAEHEKGTIAEDRRADLAVLSQDIFAAPLPEIPKTNSVLTIVGGRIVYDANVLN
jgi:predicted amidohydrolase YtcJ